MIFDVVLPISRELKIYPAFGIWYGFKNNENQPGLAMVGPQIACDFQNRAHLVDRGIARFPFRNTHARTSIV